MTYPVLRKRVKLDFRAKYGEKDMERRPDAVLVEERGSGIVLLQDLRLIGVPAFGYNPGKADKVMRANVAAPFVAAKRIYLLESGRNRGHPVSWCEEFVHELLTFPNALHDDYVDAFTQAVILLRNNELIEAKIATKEDEPPPEPDEGYINPYTQ
jgi:predicted phage terminase large subunit-like protein